MRVSPILFARVCVCVFLLVGCTTIALDTPKEVAMTRTARGWIPQQVIIRKGDVIVFKTDTGKAFWPASNFHPTHSLYAAFDPKHPVSPTEEWRFTFEKVGVWTLHDHLAPSFTGTIIVRGAPGEAERQCRSNAAKNTDLSVACWENEIVEALREGGIEKGFTVFDSLYKDNPEFQANCHDVSHALGKEAYRLFSTTRTVIDDPSTAYCGYGFYHGFIESMFIADGPSQYNDARKYCDELRVTYGDAVAGPCFHGIGHAVFDSLDGALWGDAQKMVQASLSACERALASEQEKDRVQCASGVYNALGNALSARDYFLSHDTTDIIALCRNQKSIYKEGCMIQAGIGYIRYKQMDRQQALQFVLSLEPSLAEPGVDTYINNEVLRDFTTFDPETYQKTCSSLPATVYRLRCIDGTLGGIDNLSNPHEGYKLMFSFCSFFNDPSLRENCYQSAIQRTKRLNQDYAPYIAACSAISDVPSAQRSCPKP